MNAAVLEQSGQPQTKYWQLVQLAEKQLGDTDPVYITSLNDPQRDIKAGIVKHCTRRLAARRIVENAFRLSTEDEKKRYIAEREAEVKRYAEEEDRRKQVKLGLRAGSEDNERTAALVAAAVQTVMREQGGGGRSQKETK